MSTQPSATAKTERLLNLVICLLYTRQPLSKAKIRDAVPQYGQTASTEAFDRMFERDKDELRDLGIPLVTEPLDAYFDDEPGYRIDGREYALPEISFEPDELAVLGLASRAWAQASLAGPAAQALRKLQRRRRRARRRLADRDRAAAAHRRAGLRAGQDRRASTAVPVRFTYRTARSAEVARAARAAVGDRLLARPLVPHRLRHRPGRAARVPAQPDRGRRAPGTARTGRTTCRPTTSRAP